MIDRRSTLAAGATLALCLAVPAGGFAMEEPAALDIIDLTVWPGDGGASARILIGKGAHLRLEHIERVPRSRALTALLSPANAVLLREFLRFERGVTVRERFFEAAPAALLMTAAWDDVR